MTTIEMLSTALQDHAHSFDYVRRTTKIKLTDEQLAVVVRSKPGAFKLVRMYKKDEAGNPIRPGLLGAMLVG